MPDQATIAASAVTIGIASAGILWALRFDKLAQARPYLVMVYALFSGLTAVPLVVAFAPSLYLFYLPAILPMLLALPPTFYRFVTVYTREDGSPHWHLRDVILAATGSVVVIGYWMLPNSAKATMLEQGDLPAGIMPAVLAIASLLLVFGWVLASFGYLAGAVRELRGFRMKLKDVYSNTEKRELRWIDGFMALLVVTWGAAALSLISENSQLNISLPGELVILLTAALLLFLMAFAPTGTIADWPTGSLHPPADPPERVQPGEPSQKYARSALSKDHSQRLAERIETAMRDGALYLDPNLSLHKLARCAGTLPNHASQTLNEEIGSTFFNYVARWRVEAAKPLLLSGELSVLAVALEVGFNSRSTFYKAFKRETGMTPKAFRDNARSI